MSGGIYKGPYGDDLLGDGRKVLHPAEPQPKGDALNLSWAEETMQLINKLTPGIKGKAFDPDWFLLRQRLEQFESALAENERQACWEDFIRVLRNAINDSPDSFELKALHEAIFVMGWQQLGTGDGKPMHKRADSAVSEWNGKRL